MGKNLAAQIGNTVSTRDKQPGQQIVADDLGGNIAKHERTEAKSFVVEPTAHGKEVEAVHLERPQKADRNTGDQEKPAQDSERPTAISVSEVTCLPVHDCFS